MVFKVSALGSYHWAKQSTRRRPERRMNHKGKKEGKMVGKGGRRQACKSVRRGRRRLKGKCSKRRKKMGKEESEGRSMKERRNKTSAENHLLIPQLRTTITPSTTMSTKPPMTLFTPALLAWTLAHDLTTSPEPQRLSCIPNWATIDRPRPIARTTDHASTSLAGLGLSIWSVPGLCLGGRAKAGESEGQL